jgi:hypothetical protein
MTRRANAWLAMLGATALSAACGQLIGADFDDLGPQTDASAGDSGDGGTDGDGGTSGATGSGGVNGASGTLGSGGRGGSQATGGTAGTAGSAGSGASSGTSGTSGSGGSAGTDGSGGSSGTAGSGGTLGSAGTSGSAGTGGTIDAGNGTIVINEVEGRAGNEDFIELLNLGPGPIDIGGYKVADANNMNVSPKIAQAVVFPSPTVVPPNGYVIVLGNQLAFGGPTSCLGFSPCFTGTEGVSANGERVYLLRPDNSEIEHVDYPSETSDAGLTDGQSYGRLPNGTGAFTRTVISPGQQNAAPP